MEIPVQCFADRMVTDRVEGMAHSGNDHHVSVGSSAYCEAQRGSQGDEAGSRVLRWTTASRDETRSASDRGGSGAFHSWWMRTPERRAANRRPGAVLARPMVKQGAEPQGNAPLGGTRHDHDTP